MRRRTFLVAAAVGALGCARPGSAHPAPVTTDAAGDFVQTLSRTDLPRFADTPDLRRLYRYAVERGEELRSIPCYCGCADIGHRSNRDCYVKSMNADGTLTFTSHAAT